MAYKESYAGRINRKLNKKLHVVEVAAGRQKADLVLEERDLCECVLQPAQPRRYRRGLRPDRRHGRAITRARSRST